MTALERRLEILKHNGLLLNPYDRELYERLQREVDEKTTKESV